MYCAKATAFKFIVVLSMAALGHGCASVDSVSSMTSGVPGMDSLTELSSATGLGDMSGLENMDAIPGMEGYPGLPQKVEPPPPLFETAAERTKRLETRVQKMQEQVELSKDVCAMAEAELVVLDSLLGESITEKQLSLEPPTLVERMTDFAYNTVVETVKGFLGVIQPVIQTKRTIMNEDQEEKEAEMAQERNELRRAFVIGQAANHGCGDIQESVSNL